MSGFETDIERSHDATSAQDALSRGSGVLLSGEPGSGRSRLAQAIVAGLTDTVRRRVWVHDDDRRLDDSGQRRLMDAVAARAVIPLVVSATGRPIEPWLHRLIRETEFTAIQLKPFDRSAMLRITRRFLHGPLDAKAVPALLPRRDGGDLVVLNEALREMQETGALVPFGGVWTLTGPVPPLDSLRHLAFSRIGIENPADASETLLDVIGLAPELGLARTRSLIEEMLAISPDAELERLEATGSIDVLERDGMMECRIHDPVVETLLPFTIGRLRRRRISNSIVAALSDRPADESSESELLALARLAIPLGWSVDGETLTRAAGAALRASRVDLAGRLAEAALASGAGVDASFVLAAAESQSGRSGEALLRLKRIDESELVSPDHSRTLLELVELVSERAKDPKTLWSLPVRSSAADTSDDAVENASDLAALSIPVAGSGRTGGGVLRSGLVVDHSLVLKGEKVAFEASLAVMKGHSDQAIALLKGAEVTLGEAGADTFRVRWGLSYSKLWDRSFTETYEELSLLADEAASLGQAEYETLCRWSAAWTLGYAGKAAHAAEEFLGVLDDLDRLALTDTAVLARVALAKSLAGTGQDDAAWDLLSPILVDTSINPMIGAWAHEAKGWVLRGSGRATEAVEAFETAATMQGAMGFALSQMIALSGAARAGAASRVIGEIERLAGTVDGRCIDVLVRQARALCRDEINRESGLASEFDHLGNEAIGLGMHGVAAEAFLAASRLHGSVGGGEGPRAAVASERKAADQMALCATDLFGSASGSSGELSLREREIAGLAAAGMSNREIADKLVLSIRTVETHLLRVYRKLGVRRRSELAESLLLR